MQAFRSALRLRIHQSSSSHYMGCRPVSTLSSGNTFFDMVHSNNAARIRLWLNHRPDIINESGDDSSIVKREIVAYDDLQTDAFADINPLKKVPAFIRSDGETVFEASVILSYLEDKYQCDNATSFTPHTPEDRQRMNLIVRCHDLYVASPNCTQPGFSHSQGAMYLAPYETPFCHASRCMDRETRAKKIAELWKQLSWLESYLESESSQGMVANQLSLADFTWFPTTIFMQFMLPRVFGWPDVFSSDEHLPKVSRWWNGMMKNEHFACVRNDILSFFEQKYAEGQFDSILEETADDSFQWTYPPDYANETVQLNYQLDPPKGKLTGRYIAQEDKGDLADESKLGPVQMHNARHLTNADATLHHMGFALASAPSEMSFDCFANDDVETIQSVYYKEMADLVKNLSGAKAVHCFDHTVRESGATNLNAASTSDSAAPVPRVHCDYTKDGAPRRLAQLAEQGHIVDHSSAAFAGVSSSDYLEDKRFAFINVWRSIDDQNPVMQQPLAVCDERSVPEGDKFLYYLKFPDRTGENYSLRHSRQHRWWYYPQMRHDECLVFKVHDKMEGTPQFVFHTAFSPNDTNVPLESLPKRKSVEVRTIAFF